MTSSSFARWCIAGSLLLGGGVLQAVEDWPQFRGPTQQGWAQGAKTPVEWSEGKGVKWKTPLPGEGWSSPVVADGKVWMTTALGEGTSLRALCVDFATGKLVHDIEVFAPESAPPRHRRNSYASPTPVLADGKVYVHYGTLGTACLDAKSGKKLWENLELKVDHQNGAGGGSPTLFKDKLLITCDGIDVQYEAALDAATGAVAWKTERSAIPGMAALPQDMRKAYGTPVIVELDGRTQSLSTGANRLYSYDPATGKELWFVDYPRGFSNVPMPVTDGKVVVVSTGFMKAEMWGIRVGGAKGDATQSHLMWKQNAGAPDQPSPLLINDRLYMVSSNGIVSCLNAATGAIIWKERIGSDFAASPIYANGHMYFCDTAGLTTVLVPGDTFKVAAKNELESGFMASPAVVGNALVLRTKTHLYRIE